MSVELEEALPPTGAEGARAAARGGPTAPARKRRSRKKNQPGRYSQLVVETIRRLGERGGSSLARIHAEAKKLPWFDQQNGRTYLKYSVRALVQNDTLLQVRGSGANGSFKLNRKKLEAGAARGAPAAAAKAAAPQAGRADSRPGPARPERRAPAPGKGAAAPKAAPAGAKKAKKAAKPGAPRTRK
ncbi:histone H1.10 [Dipodomys spectabilis]|uniref:histone H1.10 n=1 Tax=Dipodomys spectabilis TaxID=105255 RepID=UPI001C5407E4|nr:histone H1.10 [Dipodomys spectabilis]